MNKLNLIADILGKIFLIIIIGSWNLYDGTSLFVIQTEDRGIAISNYGDCYSSGEFETRECTLQEYSQIFSYLK